MGYKIAGILFIVIMVMAGGFYWYYQDTQKTISTLITNNARLEVAIQTSEEAISSLQSNYASANAEVQRLNTEFSSIREQNRMLQDRLSKHDLGSLATSKPALVERVINGASVKAIRCFELLSGADLTEKERNAENGQQFNSECPWLFDRFNAP